LKVEQVQALRCQKSAQETCNQECVLSSC